MKINKYVPLGTNIKNEIKAFILVLGCIFIISLQFIFRYKSTLAQIHSFILMYEKKVCIADINTLMDHSFMGIWILLIYCICLTFLHYSSFYIDSRSIYVMKRIKDKNEIHRVCLTLPILFFIIGILFILILIGIYLFIYYKMTPVEYLLPDIKFIIWRIFI